MHSWTIRFSTIALVIALLEPDKADAQCPLVPVTHTGVATFYTFASGGGACLFDPTPNDLMVGAMNAIDYENSQACGECVSVTGANGTILIRIVDLCGGCPQGHIDLSPLAFSMIADTSLGIVPITWKVVPCEVTGTIQYHFKDGSNRWWTAVQIRNHRYPIRTLEYLNSQGIYQSVNRLVYNYFVEPSGMGPGPYTFRVTDVYGRVLDDAGIPHVENGSVSGQAQFPPCDDPLPIRLASFIATTLNQQQVRLDWTTLSEIDNYGFDIQRSDTSQRHYQTLPNSFIPGHGTTNEPQRYSWTSSTSSGVLYYRLKQTDLDGSIHYSDGIRVDMLASAKEEEIPTIHSLSQNYPNPWNPSTTIRYALPHTQFVTMTVSNTLGQQVSQLVSEQQSAGVHYIVLSGDGLPSGVYIYRLQAGDFVATKKSIFMR